MDELNAARALAGNTPLPQWIDSQSKALGRLQKENQQLKTKLALGGGGGAGTDEDKVEINGATLIARQVNDGIDPFQMPRLEPAPHGIPADLTGARLTLPFRVDSWRGAGVVERARLEIV